MDKSPPRRRSPVFAALGALAAAVAVTLIVAIQTRRQSIDQWPWAVGLLGLAGICFALYWGPVGRLPASDVPTGVPPDRLFKVELMARGGWLRRILEPRTDAYLVVADDEVRLCYRRRIRPMSSVFVWAGAFLFADMARRSGLGASAHLQMALFVICCTLYTWAATRPQDMRFPWSRVHSVSVGETRFHIRVDDDDYPEGFLVQVPIGLRKPLSALFAARTLFHDEEANLAKSILESRASRE